MLLDDLVSVIETLKDRIRRHGSSLRANEIRTRTALIDPLLTALGWDVADPALVTPEYSIGEGRADYALHGSEAIPSAMVEAKRLGHALNDDERMQMLNYANARGVRYAAVTDGDVWEVYEVFKQAPLEDRRLLNLRIANVPAHELALQLLLLWRPNVASGQPSPAREPVFYTVSVTQPKTPISNVQEQPAVVNVPVESPTTSEGYRSSPLAVDWMKLSEFDPPPKTPAPSNIRFPDGSERPVSNWKHLLQVAGEWLESTGRLASAPKPIFNGREKVLDMSPSGFRAPTRITGTEFYLNSHGNADNLRRKTRALFTGCGVDPGEVSVRSKGE